MRALFWLSSLIVVAGAPLIGECIYPDSGWILLSLLFVSSYVGVLLADAILRAGRAQGRDPIATTDDAAGLAFAGIVGGILLIVGVACAGGCAW
jgi:hypothetical protein